jgi:hypothetical protein
MHSDNKHIYLKNLISWCFLFSVVIGFGGSFVPAGGVQHVFWALGAFFMIIASSLLGSKLAREEHDIPAAGFTIIAVAQAMSYGFLATHDAGNEQFGAVVAIYVPGLMLISLYELANVFIRITGFIAAVSFASLALIIFLDFHIETLSPILTQLGYAAFNICLLGWAWFVHKGKV